jgi:hypothetical protein
VYLDTVLVFSLSPLGRGEGVEDSVMLCRNLASKKKMPLTLNPKSEVSVKKSALTPALSPRRGGKGFRVRARS